MHIHILKIEIRMIEDLYSFNWKNTEKMWTTWSNKSWRISLGSFSNYQKTAHLQGIKAGKQGLWRNASWQHLQEPLDPDTLPPLMKPKGKRQRIHQSLSSVRSQCPSEKWTYWNILLTYGHLVFISLLYFKNIGTKLSIFQYICIDHHRWQLLRSIINESSIKLLSWKRWLVI